MPHGATGHRRGSSTPREAGIGDPEGGFLSSSAALRKACGAQAPRRLTRLADELRKPSYGYHMLDSIH
jgi:hypothetical protein